MKGVEKLEQRIDRFFLNLLTKLRVPNAKGVKKIFVAVVGSTLLLIGIAMIVLPGPAFVVIPLGLAVLASEFVWARRWLNRCKNLVNWFRSRRKKTA